MNNLNYSRLKCYVQMLALLLTFSTTKLLGQCDCLPGQGYNVNGGSLSTSGLPNPYTLPCLNISGTFVVDQPFTITGTFVYMEAGAKIEVGDPANPVGTVLTLNGTYFDGCQPGIGPWEGIQLNTNSALFDNSSVLLGGNTVITALQNTAVNLHGSTIANSFTGVRCQDCASIYAINSGINASSRAIDVVGTNHDADVVYKNGLIVTDEYGILIAHSGINASNIEITGNQNITVGNNSLGAGFAAVLVNGSNNPGSNLDISNNTITITNVILGISAFSSPNGSIVNNNITIHVLGFPIGGFFSRGIAVRNSNGTEIRDNTIKDPLNNQFGQPVYNKYDMSSTGIELAVSQNCLVLNNSMEETVIGMNILGICDHPNSPYGSNNHIRGNTFSQPHIISETPKLNGVDLVGLRIGADSYCGNQDCTGNEWYGEYVNGAKCQGNPLLSPFTVPVDAPPVMPPNISPASGWFFAAACRPESRNVSMDNVPVSEDDTQNARVFIYPNPAENYLKLLMPEVSEFPCTAKITNLAGKLILEKQIQLGPEESILDIKDLKTGMYIVQLVSGMTQQTKKVLVIK